MSKNIFKNVKGNITKNNTFFTIYHIPIFVIQIRKEGTTALNLDSTLDTLSIFLYSLLNMYRNFITNFVLHFYKGIIFFYFDNLKYLIKYSSKENTNMSLYAKKKKISYTHCLLLKIILNY